MTLYKIRGWSGFYENCASRKLKKLDWVAICNKPDGENFAKIVAHPEGAVIFAGFITLLQLASRCCPRGTLIKSDNSPHTPISMAFKCRCPVEWFTVSLPFLVDNTDWLEIEEVNLDFGRISRDIGRSLGESADTSGDSPATSGAKGREGKGRVLNRIESTILVVGSSILGSNVDLNSSSPATATGPSTRILKEFSPRPESESLAAIDSNNEEDAVRGMRDILGPDVFEGTPERVADGGKWRENWREKRSKVVRVFAELVATGRLGHIQAPGALAATLWREFP